MSKANPIQILLYAIADLIAVFGWAGITPENVGEAAYQVLNVITPFVVAAISFVLGWKLHKWKTEKRSLSNSGQKKYSFDEQVQIFKQEPCGKKKALSAYLYNLPDHRAIISENGAFKIQEFERPYRHYLDRKKFYSFDARGGDSVYIELEEWIIDLFEKKPELLEEFPPISLDEISVLFDQNEPNVRGLIYLD